VQVPLPVAACAGAEDAGADELDDELELLHAVTAATTATPSAIRITPRKPVRARTRLNMDSPWAGRGPRFDYDRICSGNYHGRWFGAKMIGALSFGNWLSCLAGPSGRSADRRGRHQYNQSLPTFVPWSMASSPAMPSLNSSRSTWPYQCEERREKVQQKGCEEKRCANIAENIMPVEVLE
jgi:hypothetical protein